ncbi:adenylyl-sulfate kinase [uncultured Ilyobacter sp.]|uniref:adenylyl-sulfate kinase n=1 Tax=uncultured Ilyobacter sp. TaxID=544433 RepID=UPI0029C06361|nr:adenylyl-sulfate kinase [uncultured Ilyobacter sp.]
MGENIVWHNGDITRKEREALLNQNGKVLWFTGLSGSGKSTIAVELEKELYKAGKLVYRLDGDNIRHGLNGNLGFTLEDRIENIRRISEVAKLFADSGMITLVSFISPTIEIRNMAREIIGEDFIEVYVNAGLSTCESRDPKGLYKKARAGEIKNFTGIDSPYEAPENPEIMLLNEDGKLNQCVKKVLDYLID